LRGDKWYGSPGKLGVAALMMRNAHVRLSVQAVTGPLRSADWKMTPRDKSPFAREVARFCELAFFRCLPWDAIIKRKATQYAVNGFSLSEMVDDYVDIPAAEFPLHPGGGRAIVPTGILDRPAWTVHRWLQDDTRPERLRAVEQYIIGSDVEKARFAEIPAGRLLRMTCEQEGANFSGFPILRSAYAPWKVLMLLEQVDAIKHERYGVGMPVVTEGEDPDDEDLDNCELALEAFQSGENHYLQLPHGWGATIVTQTSDTGLNQAMDNRKKDIAFNVGAGFLMLGIMGKTGSFALGETHESFFHLASEGHAMTMGEAFNLGADGWSPIERIAKLNYGPDAPVPILEPRNLPTRNWLAMITSMVSAKQAELLTYDRPTEERVREILELDPLDEETVEERKSKTQVQPEQPDDAGEETEDEDE
jgi:hypothetical protein